MTEDSRHRWQQVVIMACRACAASAFSIRLITRADWLSDWKALLGFVVLMVAVLDLAWTLLGLRTRNGP